MEFGIEKCALLVMKSGKRHLTDGMEQPNQDKIRTHGEKKTYKYLGISETDTVKQVEMKEKIKKEYPRRTGKLLETNYLAETLSINIWAVPSLDIRDPFWSGPEKNLSKWTKEQEN